MNATNRKQEESDNSNKRIESESLPVPEGVCMALTGDVEDWEEVETLTEK